MNKWQVKNPLTIEEREKIQEGLSMSLSYRELGWYVERSKSTVMRESKRLGSPETYDAKKAQQDFERKQFEKMKKAKK